MSADENETRPATWLQTVDRAVLGVCELLGLLFSLPFGEDLYRDEAINIWHGAWLAIGVICAALGPAWPYLRKQVASNFKLSIENGARNPLLWVGLILIIFLYTNDDRLVSTYLINQNAFLYKASKLLEKIEGKHFANERVILDGKDFEDCIFENVTFVYNGTDRVSFSHNTIQGKNVFSSDNISINLAVNVFYALGLIPAHVTFFNTPPSIKVTPVQPQPPPVQ